MSTYKINTPAARRSDPEASHLAADDITRSGKRYKQAILAKSLVDTYPGCTSSELAQVGILDRYQLARRLPELQLGRAVQRGPERKCQVTGRLAGTWLPRKRGRLPRKRGR